MTENTSAMLRRIPQVDAVLNTEKGKELCERYSAALAAEALRAELQAVRAQLLAGTGTLPTSDALLDACDKRLSVLFKPAKPVVINATGVMLHTNLGRAPMALRAAEAAKQAAVHYSALEFDLEAGIRGDRQRHVEDLLSELLGAQAAVVVNNNAAAVLLMLMATARGREVVVSRGELVEIGGSFRVPDIMAQSGCTLREVGTTNKTKVSDYQQAMGEDTAALLKVHCSNYKIVGFTESVSVESLAQLAKEAGLPLLYDLGSGALMPLEPWGLKDEPGPAQALRDGANVVCFSGDKLLGGPQAGIAVGDAELIGRMKRHPLMRALRPDKMTLGALESTLQLLRDPDIARREIPLYAMLSEDPQATRHRAESLKVQLSGIKGIDLAVVDTKAQVGGGSTPGQMLPSFGLGIRLPHGSVEALYARLRVGNTPIVGRLHQDSLVLDMRTVSADELPTLAEALQLALKEHE